MNLSLVIILLKENDSGLISLLLINNVLGWCLYLLIAFIMGSVMSLCSSIIYGFLFFCRHLVTVLKKLFSSSDTKCSSDIILFILINKDYLIPNFFIFWNKGYIFFQKHLLSESFLELIFSKHPLHSFLYNDYNSFSVSYISLRSLVFSS